MADATEVLSPPDLAPLEPRPENADSPNRQRLLVVSPPANRTAPKDSRPVTSLANVFGRFAEMQHLVGDQVIALEDSVQQQGQQLADVSAQLPDMKERINWLIATYYEDDRKSQAMREQLARQEAGLATLTDAVRGLCEAQTQWKQTLEQLLQLLGRAQTPMVPTPPRWPA
jgi:septal ring factor EnvC (AmiA/AmiB activator)